MPAETGARDLPERFTDRLDDAKSESEASLLLDEYIQIGEHPIPYSQLGLQTLSSLPELEEPEIQKILAFVKRHPDLASWDPLEKAFPTEVMEILRYAVVLSGENPVSGQIRWRMKSSRPGEVQWYTRLQEQVAGWVVGSLVVERDPGEHSLVDHVAGGVEFTDSEDRVQVVLGQFRLGYAQGVSFGRAMSLSKSGSVIRNADRNDTRLLVNSSSLESAGFTGIAGQLKLSHHHFRGFITASPRDGEWNGSSIRLSSSGLHLTEYARQRQNSLLERLIGMGYWYSTPQYTFGVQGAHLFYQRWHISEIYAPETFGSCWISTPWFAHETAVDQNGFPASYTSVHRQVGPATLVIGYRHYHPDYSAPFARGFQEYAGTANEAGTYLGIRWDFKRVRWQWYFDQFQELQSLEKPKRSGTEWMTQADWRPAPRMLVTVKIRHEDKEVYDTQPYEGIRTNRTALFHGIHYRYRWKYRWPSDVRFETRADLAKVLINQDRHTGTQWAFQIEYPLRVIGGKIRIMLVPYRVGGSPASTYFFVMPAVGTMQILRQTGEGVLLGFQTSAAFSPNARVSIFYLQRRLKHLKLSHILCGQFELAY